MRKGGRGLEVYVKREEKGEEGEVEDKRTWKQIRHREEGEGEEKRKGGEREKGREEEAGNRKE